MKIMKINSQYVFLDKDGYGDSAFYSTLQDLILEKGFERDNISNSFDGDVYSKDGLEILVKDSSIGSRSLSDNYYVNCNSYELFVFGDDSDEIIGALEKHCDSENDRYKSSLSKISIDERYRNNHVYQTKPFSVNLIE